MKNRATEAKKKSPDTEVNDRMDEKKFSIEDEVKNRADGRTNGQTDGRKKKIHQFISKSPMAIYKKSCIKRKKTMK